MKKAIGLVVLVFILPFIVNIPDEKLCEEAEQIITSQPKPLMPEPDNGFYALLGFEAPMGDDIYAAGKEIAASNASFRAGHFPSNAFPPEEITAHPAMIPDARLIPRCIPEKQACLTYYSEELEPLLRFLAAHDFMLERYGSLKKYAFFQNTMETSLPGSRSNLERGVFSAHLLTVGRSAHVFSSGNRDAAIRLLVSDILLWRKLLAGVIDLSDKTYSLLALRLAYTLLDEMLDTISKDEAVDLVQSRALAALSTEERSTDLVWHRRLRELAWSLSRNRWPPGLERAPDMSFLERVFTGTNATLNDAYALFHLLGKLSLAEPDEVENLRVAFAQRLEQASRLSFHKLYNPLGKDFIADSFDERAGVYWNRDIHSLDRLITRVRSRVER